MFIQLRTSRVDLSFPMHAMPKIEFAEWLKVQEQDGGVLLIPQIRPPPKSGKRADLPVFANLGEHLSSSDAQYFQVIHGKPMYTRPNLKTLKPNKQNPKIFSLVRNWDDLAKPMLSESEIPPSAYDPRMNGQRKIALDLLRNLGLKWIVVDLGAYNEQALKILKEQLQGRIESEKKFDEGDGVLVLTLN